MTAPVEMLAPARHMTARRKSWREHWIGLRNGLIENPRFQRWAASFPLTRPIAHKRARGLFDLVAGFVYSQVLAACVRLHLFDILAEAPQTLAALAPRLGLTEAASERLLKAAAALDLVELIGDDRFALGHLGAALRGNPSVAAMIEHHAILYADLADPVALLRGETDPALARFWAYATSAEPATAAPEQVRDYSRLMAESQALVAGEILDAYPMRRHRRVLDIGGGEGVFLSAVGARTKTSELMLFDLPAVAQRAATRFAEAGLAPRASIFEGSFLTDPLPSGADIATLVRVLHDHDDHAVRTILRAAHTALPKNGVLLVAETMSATPGAAPIGDAYFGFYLAAMRSGRPRTAAELSDMLRDAGFGEVCLLPTRTPLIVRLLMARA